MMAGSVTKPHKFFLCSESKKTPESQICRLSWLVFIAPCESCQAQAKEKSQKCRLVSPLATTPDYGMGYERQGNVGFSVAILSPVSSLSNQAHADLVLAMASMSQCSR